MKNICQLYSSLQWVRRIIKEHVKFTLEKAKECFGHFGHVLFCPPFYRTYHLRLSTPPYSILDPPSPHAQLHVCEPKDTDEMLSASTCRHSLKKFWVRCQAWFYLGSEDHGKKYFRDVMEVPLRFLSLAFEAKGFRPTGLEKSLFCGRVCLLLQWAKCPRRRNAWEMVRGRTRDKDGGQTEWRVMYSKPRDRLRDGGYKERAGEQTATGDDGETGTGSEKVTDKETGQREKRGHRQRDGGQAVRREQTEKRGTEKKR